MNIQICEPVGATLVQITTGSKKAKDVEVEGSPLGEKKGFGGSGKETRGGVIGACYDQNTLYTCLKLSKNAYKILTYIK